MRFDTENPAASMARPTPLSGGASADCPHHAADGGAAASLFGPLTTRDPFGAGGPYNSWDAKIAAAERRGDFKGADGLRHARARIAIAFGQLERVFVPSEGQRRMYGLTANLRSGREALRTMRAA